MLLIGMILIPVLLFVFICFNVMDSNKNEDGYNIYNSNLDVQCNAKGKCDWRHTTMCDNCKHNYGRKKHKDRFVSR